MNGCDYGVFGVKFFVGCGMQFYGLIVFDNDVVYFCVQFDFVVMIFDVID